MKKTKSVKKVSNLLFIFFISIFIISCVCKKDEIYAYEGRELYPEEINVIHYQEGDTVKFISDDETYEFICSYRYHYYDKGEPTQISHNPCEGKRLMSQDRLDVTLSTSLTSYYYQNGKVNQVDSVPVFLKLYSDYHDDSFSNLSFSLQGHMYFKALLYLNNNEIFYAEDTSPAHISYDYYDLVVFDSITLSNIVYKKVLHFTNNYPVNEQVPYYFKQLFFNEEYGIIRLIRSDSVTYDFAGMN